MSCGVVWPRDESLLPALFEFLRSSEYTASVRELDQQLKLTTKTGLEVPFDVDRWRSVAEERWPDGLPEPWSDDATQWLFEGRPGGGGLSRCCRWVLAGCWGLRGRNRPRMTI